MAGEELATLGLAEAPHSRPPLHGKEAEPVAEPHPGCERARGIPEGTPCTLASCLEHPGTWRGSLLHLVGPCAEGGGVVGAERLLGALRGRRCQECGDPGCAPTQARLWFQDPGNSSPSSSQPQPLSSQELHSFSVSTALPASQPFSAR